MLKVGFIGTGGISGTHLAYLSSRDDVEIAALCDVDQGNLQRRAKEFGGQAFVDYRKMLDAVKLDAVWLCTPPQVRAEPLLACAERGVPVFCEKPVERDEAKAAKTADQLDALGAHVQVGYVFRSLPVVKRLRQWVADDAIHLVQSFYGCNVSLTRGLASWFYDKDKSGGPLVDQATHNLDLLRYLLGEVTTVCGVGSNPVHAKEAGYTIDETLAFSFTFRDGIVGSHTHTWVGDGWRNEVFLSGEKRSYWLNLNKETLTVEEGDESRRLAAGGRGMFCHEDGAFVNSVASGVWDASPSSYRDGLATLRLTLACDRALTEGLVNV